MIPQTKTIGEKIVSVLKQPLFTIPFSIPVHEKKIEKKAVKKAVEPKKPIKRNQNRYLPSNRQNRQIPVRNSSQRTNANTQIITLSRNKDEYEKILFILRACDESRSPSYTNVLHVERTKNGSRLIATDGKRMHVAEIKIKIKPGEYKPVITKDAIKLGEPVKNIKYPNWEQVVPKDVDRRGCINFENTADGETNRALNSFTKMSGENVNPKYLSDLTKKSWVIYSQKQRMKALLLKEYCPASQFGAKHETYAVIMPLSA